MRFSLVCACERASERAFFFRTYVHVCVPLWVRPFVIRLFDIRLYVHFCVRSCLAKSDSRVLVHFKPAFISSSFISITHLCYDFLALL